MKNNTNYPPEYNHLLQSETSGTAPTRKRASVFDSPPFKEALAVASIPALWEHFKLNGVPTISCCSPFREDNKPSFSVFQNAEGAWHFNDFADTEFRGDAYEFYIHATEKKKSEASAKEFIELVASLPKHEASSHHGYEDCPTSSSHHSGTESPDFISMAAAFSSCLQNDPVLITNHAAELGVQDSTISRLAEEGCLGHSQELGGLTIHTPHGIQFRRSTGKRQNIRGSRQDLWRGASTNVVEVVVLTEGASDAIAAIDAGVEDDGTTAVVALPTASTSFREPGIEGLKNKDVILVPDRDKAGRQMARKAQERLLPIVRSLRVFSWEAVYNLHPNLNNDVNDLRDLHANLGREIITQILTTCSDSAQPEPDGSPSGGCCSANEDDANPEPLSSSFPDLMNKDIDPGGELIQDGFLRRGQSATIVAPTGAGKSSLTMQIAACFALGRECLGLQPAAPLKVMLIQSENDDADQKEMAHGINEGLGFSQPDLDLLKERCLFRECQDSGDHFLDGMLRKLIQERNPDLVILDPYGDFQDDTALNEQKVKAFLGKLRGIIKNAGCGCILVHHTPKPSKERSSTGSYDEQYLGYGTSLVSNHVRGILILKPLNSRGFFEMKAAKRGERLRWTDDNGAPTLSKFIRHADQGEGIFWKLATTEEIAAERGNQLGRDGNRKKGAEDVIRFLQEYEEPVDKGEVATHLNTDPGKLSINDANKLLKKMVKEEAIFEHEIPRKGRKPAIGISLQPPSKNCQGTGEDTHGQDENDVNASS